MFPDDPQLPISPLSTTSFASTVTESTVDSTAPSACNSAVLFTAPNLIPGLATQSSSNSSLTSLQQWKLQQQQKIAQRQVESEEKHKAILEKAAKDLESFYSDYERAKAEAIEGNRQRLLTSAALGATPTAECATSEALSRTEFWSRVKKICDRLKRPKSFSKDISRFREVLASASQ